MAFQTARTIPAGRQIRVLIVDDSVVIRRLITKALSEDADLEIVGTASNGSIALAKIPQVNPDVITLDIDMPQMDGLETLRQIRKLYPRLCVIMFSTLTERGASKTFEALSLSANDYVTKAANVGSLDKSLQNLRGQLTPKIRQFFSLDRSSSVCGAQPVLVPNSPVRRNLGSKKEIIAIGVSTGGPNALAEIFPYFPEKLACPIVIVQHMPPIFTRLLAQRLQSCGHLTVEEAREGMVIEPGKAIVAAGGFHLVLKRSGTHIVAGLTESPPVNSCRPAVDVLFASVAAIYGSQALGVILTGMGQDGLSGVRQIKAKGAAVIAQDEATSVVWGMPDFVAQAGLADVVAPINEIAPEILKRV